MKAYSSSEESSDDSQRDNNQTFYSVDRILKYQGDSNVNIQKKLSLLKQGQGTNKLMGNLGTSLFK